MLHLETVESHTFDLLKRLMNDEILENFNLVGGTSLSLQIGHRKSIDLDMFSSSPFLSEDLRLHLKSNYEMQSVDRQTEGALITRIEGVKVDFIRYHQYPMLELVNEGGIRMASIGDISAMKLNAISRTGERLKDFVDIACLSTRFPLRGMIENFENKYNSQSLGHHILISLAYHKEIDHAQPVEMINGAYKWEIIEERIQEMIDNPDTVFRTLPLARDYREELAIAALKNDLKSVLRLKEQGLLYSPAIGLELRSSGVSSPTLIAIQKIFGVSGEKSMLNDMKLAGDIDTNKTSTNLTNGIQM